MDVHLHMDGTFHLRHAARQRQRHRCSKAYLRLGEPRPSLTVEAIIERALTTGDWAVAQGPLAIRSHVGTPATPPAGSRPWR